MDFQKQLEKYAELIVIHGLNVQPGQFVNISTEAIHRDLAVLIAKRSYFAGARYVNIDLGDARLGRLRILNSAEGDLSYTPRYLTTKFEEMVDETAANLRILGSEDPDILADLDPKRVNTVRRGLYEAAKYFYQEGIGKSKVHWTVAGAATPKWGKKVFPELDETEACARLWQEILKCCRADRDDCLQAWRSHNDALRKRAEHLSSMHISDLHFTGPGTDLHVGLSRLAKFKGGTDMSPRGVEFEPNIPTEEVFSTPDWRRTNGHVRATRPFLINGVLIRDWTGEFKDGILTSFNASSGKDTFREYIESDVGGKRLGEVALVGIDSPIFQSGIVFQEILYDENAACHIAVGSAYKFCLEGGENLSAEELDSIGCNESSVHTDMMISDEHVSVTAETYNGENIQLIKSGRWCV